MRHVSFVITGLLLFSNFSFAQKNFLEGFVVNHDNDTLMGFIDYRNWDYNPTSIRFKYDIKSESTRFSSEDVIAFNVNSELYVSALVETEISAANTNVLSIDPNFILQTENVFAHVLVKGPKSLYQVKTSEGVNCFYTKQDNELVLLKYKKYRSKTRDKNIILENNKFIGQLRFYLNDCQNIQSKLNGTSYHKKDLIRLFQYYYNCTSTIAEHTKSTEKPKLEVGILVGPTFTSLELKGEEYTDITNADFNNSTDFIAGIFLEIVMPKFQQKWSFNNELVYSSYKMTGYYQDYKNENEYTNTTTTLGYSYIKMNNALRYNYPLGKMGLFFNAGISNGFAIQEINKQSIESKFYSSTTTIEEEALEFTKKYEFGILLGLGVNFKKLLAEVRYERGNGMSNTNKIKSIATRYHVILSYRF